MAQHLNKSELDNLVAQTERDMVKLVLKWDRGGEDKRQVQEQLSEASAKMGVSVAQIIEVFRDYTMFYG